MIPEMLKGHEMRPTPGSESTPTLPDPLATGALRAMLNGLEQPGVLAHRDGRILSMNALAQRDFGQAASIGELFARVRITGPFAGWPGQLQVTCSARRVYRARAQRSAATGGEGEVVLRCVPLADGAEPELVFITWGPASSDERGLAGDSARRLTSLGKLAAQVAHELNNPLDGILRYINLALRVSGASAEGRLTHYLTESRTGLLRMRGIIGDLLAFSRTAGDDFEEFTVAQIIEQALHSATARADAGRVMIAVDLQTQGLPVVRGSRLYQVCSNLIGNSLDAMPDGGRLTISAGLVEGDVVIRVADTGAGLPDPPERVFEPFFTTKAPGAGTGLGLAICREIIEEMRGTITAERGAPSGAVFTVRIPATSCQGPAPLTRA